MRKKFAFTHKLFKGNNFFLLSFMAVLAVFQLATAQGGWNRYAGEFLYLETSARVQALGGAGVVLQQDVSTMNYNPAGLFGVSRPQATLMHAWQFVDFVNFDFGALAFRLDDRRVLGISVSHLGVENILDTRQAQVVYGDSWRLDWSRVTRFSTADYAVTIALAQEMRWLGRVGIATRLLYRDFGDVQAWGMGVDVGMQHPIGQNGMLGVVIRNATTTMVNWSTGTRELVAPQIRIGGAYRLVLSGIHSQVMPVVELVLNTVGNTTRTDQGGLRSTYFEAIGGLEWQYRQTISLRTGMDPLGRFSAGIGIQIPHIRFDYAFLSFSDELGNAHRVGMVVGF